MAPLLFWAYATAAIACGSMVLLFHLLFVFCSPSEKTNNNNEESTAADIHTRTLDMFSRHRITVGKLWDGKAALTPAPKRLIG
jgi:hypothetical protein